MLQFFDSSGNEASGFQLFTYLNRTTTKVTTYLDAQGTPNENPIDLNARGEASVFLPAGQLFTYVLAPATDTDPPTNSIWTQNDISAGGGVATINFTQDTGTVNAYVATVSGVASLFAGLTLTLLVASTNTLPATLNVNGLGPKPIVIQNGSFLYGPDLQAGGQYFFQYTGTTWMLMGQSADPNKQVLPGETAAGVTPVNYFFDSNNAWRFLTAAQIVDIIGYTFLVDCTSALQNWANACYQGSVSPYLPGGGYLISGDIVLNASDQTNYRGRAIFAYGDGGGPAFVMPGVAGVGTTVIRSTTDSPLMRYAQSLGAFTSSGNFGIEKIRFEQILSTAQSPVLQPEIFGENSYIRNCELYVGGVGNGILYYEGTKGKISAVNILNRDWATPPVTRVGTGIAGGAQYSAGLMTVEKVTSRGFLYGFSIQPTTAGYAAWNSTSNYVSGNRVVQGGVVYACILANTNQVPPNGTYWTTIAQVATTPAFYDCEVSNCTNGWLLNGTANALLSHCYNDGGVTGTVVIDEGAGTIVEKCYFNAGYTVGYDGSSALPYGAVIWGNTFGVTGPNSTCIKLNSSGAFGGPGLTCRDNYLAYSTPGNANVTGILITGIDPRISGLDSNTFNPRGPWTGSGSAKVVDNSTSSTGSAGSGVYGIAKAIDGNYEFPLLGRGAVSLGRNATPLGNVITGTVLKLGQESLYEVVPTGNVASITAIDDSDAVEGMLYILRFEATSFTWTFTAGSKMKLPSTSDLQTTTAGGVYVFQMDAGVARLIAPPVTY